MSDLQSGLVPLIDEVTGRLPDSFAPPSVADIADLGERLPGLENAADLVTAASAGVAAPGHAVSWSGSEALPAGEGFILATLTGDTTLSLPARGSNAESVNLLVKQDSTGGRKLTLEGAATAYGVAIDLTDDGGALDFITLVWTGSQWLAFMGAANLLIPAEWVV